MGPAPCLLAHSPAPEPVQEVDLLGGLDDDTFSSSTAAKPPPGFSEKALPAVAAPVQNNVIGIDGETTLGQAQPLINFYLSLQTTTLPISKLPQRLLLPL